MVSFLQNIAKKDRRGLPLIIVVTIAVILVTVFLIYLSSRNTAKDELLRAFNGFSQVAPIRWYCENGAGKGFDNSTNWWEEVYVSNNSPKTVSLDIDQQLRGKGYTTVSRYIEKSTDSLNYGKTYWEITGKRAHFSITIQISHKSITTNDCFPGSSHMDEHIKPENYNSAIVIICTDESE